jgi:RHS repeat-associated protein
LQDLNYSYDATGNITRQTDKAQQTFYFNNAVIAPTGTYQYDALYRLTQATGRELTNLAMPTANDFPDNIPCPNPAANAMQNYTQQYQYDELGNILQMQSLNNWKRNYMYDTATNRLLRHSGTTNEYTYDAHGNMLSMPHLSVMSWDEKDQLHSAGNRTFISYYNYDAQGNRTRKVVVKGNIIETRYYIGGYEVFRKENRGTLDTERTTLNISDDEKVFVRIETKTGENPVVRYQYDNHLGSACLELDKQGNIISYEEYHPFGTTSYRSGKTETEVSLKRYKYCGKERDEETGLYYYGMRYYAAWLCRFVSVDPLQFEYLELTPFQYASNRPITMIDLDGEEAADPKTGKISGTIYFQFVSEDTDHLSNQEKQDYVDAFAANVKKVWEQFSFNGNLVDLSGMKFEVMTEENASSFNANDSLLTVGNGTFANPNSIPGRDYIDEGRRSGYMYYDNSAELAAHEFGHIMGLSDRYADVMYYGRKIETKPTGDVLHGDDTIPLVLPKGETDYNPLTNLMSGGGTFLTQKQLSIVFNNGKTEQNYPAPVILAVNKMPKAVSVKGGGVNFSVTRYSLNSKGVLKKGNNNIEWAAKRGVSQNYKSSRSPHFRVQENWKNIGIRTR